MIVLHLSKYIQFFEKLQKTLKLSVNKLLYKWQVRITDDIKYSVKNLGKSYGFEMYV